MTSGHRFIIIVYYNQYASGVDYLRSKSEKGNVLFSGVVYVWYKGQNHHVSSHSDAIKYAFGWKLSIYASLN